MSELTVMVDLGGRQVEMRKPTDGALVVLARVSRGLPNTKIENDGEKLSDEAIAKLTRSLGTLGKVVDGMIVQDADKDWLDDAMIDGTVTAEDVFDVIRIAGEKFNSGGKAGPVKVAANVRRRR